MMEIIIAKIKNKIALIEGEVLLRKASAKSVFRLQKKQLKLLRIINFLLRLRIHKYRLDNWLNSKRDSIKREIEVSRSATKEALNTKLRQFKSKKARLERGFNKWVRFFVLSYPVGGVIDKIIIHFFGRFVVGEKDKYWVRIDGLYFDRYLEERTEVNWEYREYWDEEPGSTQKEQKYLYFHYVWAYRDKKISKERFVKECRKLNNFSERDFFESCAINLGLEGLLMAYHEGLITEKGFQKCHKNSWIISELAQLGLSFERVA